MIYGVRDGSFEVKGVEKDEVGRKNKQQLTDWLSNISLSGGVPQFDLETFEVKGHSVDVLTILNTNNVPQYLTKPYKDGKKIMGVGQIFSRTNDSNTPINQTADVERLEFLFKKRLGLHESIEKRYLMLVDQIDDWSYFDESSKLIYKFDPNFYIQIEEYDASDRRIKQGDYYPWLIDVGPEWTIREYDTVKFMYGQHKIMEVGPLLWFDRYRGVVIAPELGEINHRQENTGYRYLTKDSLKYKFFKLLKTSWNEVMSEDFDQAHYSTREALENIVIFDNDEDRLEFEARFYGDVLISDLETILEAKLLPDKDEAKRIIGTNNEYTEHSIVTNNLSRAIQHNYDRYK
ncbi:hypothetical protein OIT47_011075 [Weissella sp. BK2]|uniref:Uncharacterized protein n=1 Tax=Weissella fermenti TaxID=2987699 RepID=A0ABT6D6M8_9LACO|nr:MULTISPECIES: hypothetical protein [Weissella]MDF9300803.1 hypothetical protein [Weissella sp. BK2]